MAKKKEDRHHSSSDTTARVHLSIPYSVMDN